MKASNLIKTVLRVSVVLSLFLGAARLQARGSEREDAVKQLEEARKAKHPVEHLEKAKHHLEDANGKRHSENKEAVTRIERAIEADKKGDRKLMEALIKEALEELRKPETDAPRKKR